MRRYPAPVQRRDRFEKLRSEAKIARAIELVHELKVFPGVRRQSRRSSACRKGSAERGREEGVIGKGDDRSPVRTRARHPPEAGEQGVERARPSLHHAQVSLSSRTASTSPE